LEVFKIEEFKKEILKSTVKSMEEAIKSDEFIRMVKEEFDIDVKPHILIKDEKKNIILIKFDGCPKNLLENVKSMAYDYILSKNPIINFSKKL
jgi:hypothetical protein